MSNLPDYVLDDPRLVTKDIGGRTYRFWLHRRAFLLAKKHGYDPEKLDERDTDDPMAGAEDMVRLTWMAHLPFEPDLSFEEYDMRFLPQDYPLLGEVAAEIARLQMGGGSTEESPKKGASTKTPSKRT